MRHLITFGGRAYDHITEKLIDINSPRFSDEPLQLRIYDDKWLLRQEFFQLNRWLWDIKGVGNIHGGRGFGWFCWKPFIILHALERIEPGDTLLYLDGDTYPIADFSVLYDICERDGGIMLFKAQGCGNRQWVKRDCWIVMGEDETLFPERPAVPIDTDHCAARFMLFQKGPWKVQQLLMEWLTYCLNPYATTFEPSRINPCGLSTREHPENPGFNEHRTEQAILSVLAHKYKLKLYREACQFGASREHHPEDWDLYGQLFEQIGDRQMDIGVQGSRFANVP